MGGKPGTEAYRWRQRKFYFRVMLWVVGWTYWLLCHIYFRLMPRTTINQCNLERIDAQPLKGIMVPWHCYVPYGWYMTWNRDGVIMVSRSNFGAVAAAVTSRLGCIPVRGGSRIGGQEALAQVVDHVKAGRWGLLVADGPRGPRFVCKIGPILAAQRTGRPLVPVAFSAKRQWTFKTWDRMLFPKPFTPVLWVFGDPFWVGPDLGPEALEARRRELEGILLELYRRAQAYWGRNPEPLHDGRNSALIDGSPGERRR